MTLYEITVDDTNEVELEHYFAMSKYSHEEDLKGGDYTVQDLMQSIADGYEMEYNKIIKAHENGGRKVKYSLTGETTLTLEQDLRGLGKNLVIRFINENNVLNNSPVLFQKMKQA